MKYHRIALYIALFILFSACNKDLGNYDYHDINEITISGIEEGYTVRTAMDTLRIHPTLTMSEPGVDTSRYRYAWVVNAFLNFQDTIGRTLNLQYPVQLESGKYELYLRIYDKESELVTSKHVVVNVGTALSRGVMLIGEDEAGQAEVDMITMAADTSIVRGLLSNSGLPRLSGPIGVQHSGGSRTATMSLWVFTQSGSYRMDRSTFTSNVSQTLAPLVYTTFPIDRNELHPCVMAPQISGISGSTAAGLARYMVTQNGHIFGPNTIENGGDFYAQPLSRDTDNPSKLLSAAPYLFYPLAAMTSTIWYDKTNERFMNIPNYLSTFASTKLTDRPDDIFPWNQAPLGRTLVYGENSFNTDLGAINGNSFALMKDKANSFYIYKFYANGGVPSKNGYYPIKAIAQDLDKASQYAFSAYRTLMFYIVNGVLYAYDYNPGNEKLYQLDVTNGDQVTMIKFDTQMNPTTNSLYIASYNSASKGTLQRYSLTNDVNTVILTPVAKEKWSNLVKVKNMSWRAVD